jgi:hypothetical protein
MYTKQFPVDIYMNLIFKIKSIHLSRLGLGGNGVLQSAPVVSPD